MATLDPARYPRLAGYLGRLPGGFSAFPACRIRADFAAQVQRENAPLWQDPALPLSMRGILARPWSEDEWIPVVVVSAQAYILQDRLGLTDDDLVERSLSHALQMLDRPLNRTMMRVVSPHILIMGTSWRWQSFHRGIDLANLGGDRASHALKLTSPPHLLSEVAIRFYGGLFRGLIERSRGSAAVVETDRIAPGEVHYRLRWQMPT